MQNTYPQYPNFLAKITLLTAFNRYGLIYLSRRQAMDNMNVSLDRSFPSIFDDEDNVYNTCPVNGDLRPSSRARKERMEASTRTDTPSRRRS